MTLLFEFLESPIKSLILEQCQKNNYFCIISEISGKDLSRQFMKEMIQ